MPKRKARCPECNARLVLPAGADEIECPKCESTFLAPDGADDGDEPAAGFPYRTLALAGVGGVAAIAAVAAVLVSTGAFERKPANPPVQQVEATIQRLPSVQVLPEISPAADDADPFRPDDVPARAVIAQLDKYAATGPEIPQNPVRIKAVRAARLDWSRGTIERAFDRAGRTDAPWAPKARAALALRAQELAVHPGLINVGGPSDSVSAAALAAAVADGCDDPLVLYYHQGAQLRADAIPRARILNEVRRVTKLVWESRYPDERKVYAVHNMLVQLREDRAPADEIATWEERFWTLLARVCADQNPVVQERVLDVAVLREQHAMLSGQTREKAFEEVAACLTKGGAPDSTRLTARGAFLIRFAWDARGYGYATTVTPEGWRLFGERLAEAEDVLTAAYDADQDRAGAATNMLTVCMGRGHPRAEMEVWFERALRADPDNFQACSTKVELLHPKWGGTDAEYLGFAWQCVRTRNAVGLLPFAAVNNLSANIPVGHRVTAPVLAQVQPQYANVFTWQVLNTGLSVLRHDRPELRWVRGSHARLACIAGHHGVAVRELNALGDDFRGGGFGTAADLGFYRVWARIGRLPGG